MSRSAACLALAVTCLPVAARAQQDDGPLTAEQADENAREAWSIKAPDVDPCDDIEEEPGVIVVCRERTDPERYLLNLPTRADTEVSGSGAPRAPPIEWLLRPCSSYTMCMKFGKTPPQVYYLDFDAIPETPAGSDAARLYGGPTDADLPADVETEEPDLDAGVAAGLEDDVIGP